MEILKAKFAAWLSRHALPLLSGLLLSLSFPNIFHPDFFLPGVFIAWFCLVPLLLSIEGDTPGAAFNKGYVAGLFFFLLSTAWINNIRPMGPGAAPAWLSLSTYLALYPAAFCWTVVKGREARLRFEALWIPALWTMLEWLREWMLTGYPWVSLGSSQYLGRLWLPLASVTGVYGLHFVVASFNLALAHAFKRRKAGLYPVLVIALMLGLRLAAPAPRAPEPGVKVAVLQGNIDQDQAWTESYRHELMTVYGRLMDQAVKAGAKVLVWPESSFPGFFNDGGPEAETVLKFAAQNKVDLIFGSSLADREQMSYFNAVVWVDAQGNSSDYRKRHLVPFGEYIPFRAWLPPLDRLMSRMGLVDFKAGNAAQAKFSSQGLGIAPLICYESVYGGLTRKSMRGSPLLVLATLDTWFGNSAAPRYHFVHSVLRAVENGAWVARSAATGISGFVSPAGEILDTVALNTEGWSMREIPRTSAPTLYQRFGPWFLWLCALMIFVCWVFRPKSPL